MSVYTAHRGDSGGPPGAPDSQRGSSPHGLGLGLGGSLKQPSGSDVSERENEDPFLSSARKLGDMNSTYVISAWKAPGETPLTPHPAGRLALQRRVTRNKESSLLGSEVGESSERKTETRLRLQRRVRAGSVDRQATAGADSVDRQATAGANSVDRQATAGADSVDRQAIAGADSVDRQAAAGADSVDRQATAGADSVGRQTTARADSVDRWTTAGADSVGRWTTAGADSVDRQATAGANSVGRWTTAAADSVGKQTTARADSVGRWTTAAADSVGRRTTAAADSVGRQTTARADSVDRWTTAGADSVGRWTTAGADSVGRQTTAGADSVGRQTTAKADSTTQSVGRWATAGADSAGRRTKAEANSMGRRTTAGADSVGRWTTAAADSVGRQTTAGADSVGRWTTAGADSVGRRTTATADSVDRRTTAKADSVGRQTTAAADSVGRRTTARADSMGRRTTAGADSVDRQTTAGADSVDRQTTAGADSVGRQTTAGADSVDRQTTAGADSVGRQTTAGADSVGRWTTAGADSVGRQTTAKADSTTQSVGRWATAGADSVDRRTTAAADSVGRQTIAGADSVGRWTTAGADSVSRRTTAAADSVDRRTTAAADSVGRQTTAAADSVDRQTTAGADSVGRQTTTKADSTTQSMGRWTTVGADSVDRWTTAAADSVDRQTKAGADSVDRRTTAAADSVGRWTTAEADSVGRWTTAEADSVGRWTTAGADSVDRQTTAAADSVGRQTTAGADSTTQSVGGAAASDRASRATSGNVRIGKSEKNSLAASPASTEDSDAEPVAGEKDRGTFSALSGAHDSETHGSFSHSTPIRSQKEAEEARPGPWASEPTPDVRVSGTGNRHHTGLGEDVAENTNKFESSGKGTPATRMAEHAWTPRRGTPQPWSAATSTLKRRTPSSHGQQKPKRTLFANKRAGCHERTLPPREEAASPGASPRRDPLKAENSQVTVAVRVRPFSKREKDENAAQVVFLDGEEIAVRHPDLRQAYSFLYDVSFWSLDEGHPRYASQAAVYETLAAPLLARALEGYNACLFAYGQTGSGKSYTMMGFGEEPGIIPRFCEDLFAQVAKNQAQEVRYHLEMSFFEVYNEKIHDLLVGRGGSRQRKQPLRVREHPVSGPYVEALAVNAVGSYSDIQGWLQLGSKQRATAATGMNDKSSRSHSVLTLLMTRTQTELVDGEEHDHAVTSRISLVDLAGSERQGPAGTSGQQLKEGVSINKSLLTLGKVISALAEHGGRRRAFIPYRESVLTWLLKESLGGNSKTAMIATVSPAASSLEETLSTLRYARQARSIVNVARVNEDTSAQLIRELKAEIEKLKAAQRSRQNIDPERYRLCRQEITSLRMKLHEQERAMVAMQRAWKEKFEQAEKRKHHEIRELQKAGITFQVDNRLPSLVNLSEDPQLSETLLYVIREGTTAVGKRGPTSSPDIQLSGVLVADEHCTISNVDGTVSIAPVGEARTYVNGKHVLGPTVLHHGDRVVLGGDHYFRLNHPEEARSGKRPPGGGAPAAEGPKDFEFARNEWLAAQRSQLEAEIQEAQLRAKQEMLQGIQVAKEVAEQELSSQRAAFEGRIEALQAELKEESQQKRLQEMSNQKAHVRIEELERAKQRLEQEVQANRRRLQLERLAAQQALEDHSVRHTRILEALEAEKQKIAQEVQALQQNRGRRDQVPPVPTSWGSLKLSLMIQEANALSGRSQGQFVFGRHEAPDGGAGPGPRVRVRNLRLGVSTLWSPEKFESKLAALKELDESHCKCEDLFCDPEDEWEPDLTDAPAASFSRRRSRSLVKDRRVSSYLHAIQAPAAPSLRSSRSSGSGEKPGSLGSSSSGSPLPGICRELIGSSLAVLGRSGEEETVADGLVDGLLRVHGGLLAISRAHAAQDEDSPDDLFSADRAAQARAVQVACAFGQLAALAPHWPGDAPPGPPAARLGEELRQEVEKLGSYLQVFLQGCSSDIPSMVTDAQKRAAQAVRQAVACVGRLAVLSGTRLRLLEPGACGGADAQEDLADALWDGVGVGLRLLIDSALERAGELRRELSGQRPQTEAAQQLSAKAEALIGCQEAVLAAWKAQSSRTRAQEEPSGCGALREMADGAPGMWELTRCLEQTVDAVLSALRGRRSDGGALRTCVERVCVLAGDVGADSCAQSRGDLVSAAKSLLLCFEAGDSPALSEPWGTCHRNSGEGRRPPGAGRGVPKRVYALPARSPRSSGERAPGGTQWV